LARFFQLTIQVEFYNIQSTATVLPGGTIEAIAAGQPVPAANVIASNLRIAAGVFMAALR
jgi:hypothetical protein